MDFSTSLITLQQTLIMALYLLAGIVLHRTGLLRAAGIKDLTNLVLYLIMPCLILDSFIRTPFSPDKITAMGIAALVAFVAHLLGIISGRLVFRREQPDQNAVLRFATIFSNAAYFAFPVIAAVVGESALLYAAIYVVFFNLFTWTYGLVLMSPSKAKLDLSKILLNPGVLGVSVGLIIFFSGWAPPLILRQSIHSIGQMNGPLAMITVGAQISAYNAGNFFLGRSKWKLLALRNLVLPLITVALILALTKDRILALALAIPAASPTAVNCALFATRFDRDVKLSVQLIALTTFFSIFTIPLIAQLVEILIKL